MRFRVRAHGERAAAGIEVLDDALRIEVSLQWLPAKEAHRLLTTLRKEAARLPIFWSESRCTFQLPISV